MPLVIFGSFLPFSNHSWNTAHKAGKVCKIIRIYHEFVDRIDNSVPRVTAWHHAALPRDAQQ